MIANPVRNFLASPSVGAVLGTFVMSPNPSNASLSLLSLAGINLSCLGRILLPPVNAKGASAVL
jgi:hypothetical protein